ncbi:hypothetical protein K470DRAFT_249864 [Piedraia hortae CBS 480.64]|uniref:Bromodomain associated domain-containing protein n=1 Tax=Piedraia hortae CBS 480.64 TaxID=1314780 RepID=A0A6A7BWI3_9PEZI|nr:hypothetical protein K470DRAFT_249864 [Piedraia hortae CBS 480.64]
MSQERDLHRALLRPAVIYTLRAAGFHSTKPTVLDTLTDLAERYLSLLASTTAAYTASSPLPREANLTDVRLALTDCGAIRPVAASAAEEAWAERLRGPAQPDLPRKQQEEDKADLRGVRDFIQWFDGPQFAEARRIAGMPVPSGDDFLCALRKKFAKTGDESRLVGTVLGREMEKKEEGEQRPPDILVSEWRPKNGGDAVPS